MGYLFSERTFSALRFVQRVVSLFTSRPGLWQELGYPDFDSCYHDLQAFISVYNKNNLRA